MFDANIYIHICLILLLLNISRLFSDLNTEERILRNRLITYALLMLILFILIPKGNAHLISAGSCENFSYTYESTTEIESYIGGDPVFIGAKKINILYGGSNSYSFTFIDEPNRALTGWFAMDFNFLDQNGNPRDSYVDKLEYEANGFLYERYGDVDWIKANIYNFSKEVPGLPHGKSRWLYACGVSNVTIKEPKIEIIQDIETLCWEVKYNFIVAKTYINNWTANWNVNSTGAYRHVFHFYVLNQTAHTKIDFIASNFKINPGIIINKTKFENAYFASGWHYALKSQIGDHNWTVDGKNIDPGEWIQIAHNASIAQGGKSLIKIDLGSKFIYNNNEEKSTINKVLVDEGSTENKWLTYYQYYYGLNYSNIQSIEIDPEIIIFFSPTGGRYIPGYNVFLLITIIFLIYGVKLSRKY